ncbi:MAG TPA: hypothetical protein PLN85_01340 [archaeon]|nr:hypothetical protein [archaeon]
MNNITIEQYDNLFLLVKKILEFYSDEENYKLPSSDSKFKDRKIIIDNGTQAKFALSKIDELIKFNEDIDNEYFERLNNEDITENKINEIFNNLDNLTKNF